MGNKSEIVAFSSDANFVVYQKDIAIDSSSFSDIDSFVYKNIPLNGILQNVLILENRSTNEKVALNLFFNERGTENQNGVLKPVKWWRPLKQPTHARFLSNGLILLDNVEYYIPEDQQSYNRDYEYSLVLVDPLHSLQPKARIKISHTECFVQEYQGRVVVKDYLTQNYSFYSIDDLSEVDAINAWGSHENNISNALQNYWSDLNSPSPWDPNQSELNLSHMSGISDPTLYHSGWDPLSQITYFSIRGMSSEGYKHLLYRVDFVNEDRITKMGDSTLRKYPSFYQMPSSELHEQLLVKLQMTLVPDSSEVISLQRRVPGGIETINEFNVDRESAQGRSLYIKGTQEGLSILLRAENDTNLSKGLLWYLPID